MQAVQNAVPEVSGLLGEAHRHHEGAPPALQCQNLKSPECRRPCGPSLPAANPGHTPPASFPACTALLLHQAGPHTVSAEAAQIQVSMGSSVAVGKCNDTKWQKQQLHMRSLSGVVICRALGATSSFSSVTKMAISSCTLCLAYITLLPLSL